MFLFQFCFSNDFIFSVYSIWHRSWLMLVFCCDSSLCTIDLAFILLLKQLFSFWILLRGFKILRKQREKLESRSNLGTKICFLKVLLTGLTEQYPWASCHPCALLWLRVRVVMENIFFMSVNIHSLLISVLYPISEIILILYLSSTKIMRGN